MGVVYEAEHPIIGRRVALKVLNKELCDQPKQVERFFAEARSRSATWDGALDAGNADLGFHYPACP